MWQRKYSMPNPYVILGLLVAWAASLAGVGIWQRHDGAASERVVWQARDSKELSAANAKILKLETDARATEQAHGEVQHLISQSYQKDLQNAETQRQADVAAARSGALRLRDPGARTESTCSSGLPAIAASTSGRNGEAGSELSPESTEFLYSEANRADATVVQLVACQKIVDADRAEPVKTK
jgi:hypothetical protein